MAHRRVQAVNVAYQGLAGAFSEAAAAALFPGATLVPRPTFAEVFAALEGSEVDATVVPVDSIETSRDNFTRFFALSRDADRAIAERIPPALRGGPTKTSLVYKTANLPGALVRSLQPFAVAWLQLSKIESRPSRAAPWDYVFYLDFEGDPAAWPAREALALMRTCCEWI